MGCIGKGQRLILKLLDHALVEVPLQQRCQQILPGIARTEPFVTIPGFPDAAVDRLGQAEFSSLQVLPVDLKIGEPFSIVQQLKGPAAMAHALVTAIAGEYRPRTLRTHPPGAESHMGRIDKRRHILGQHILEVKLICPLHKTAGDVLLGTDIQDDLPLIFTLL